MLSAPIWRNGDVIISKFTRNLPKDRVKKKKTDMLNKSTLTSENVYCHAGVAHFPKVPFHDVQMKHKKAHSFARPL